MRKRTGEPWLTAGEYGRTLAGLSLNLIVRDIARSVFFYRDVLGFSAPYSDPDFAALERDGVRIQLHADHTYEDMPWASPLASGSPRGLGAEIRLFGIDPDGVERAARERGVSVLIASRDTSHGWRECYVQDPDGYVIAVGAAPASSP